MIHVCQTLMWYSIDFHKIFSQLHSKNPTQLSVKRLSECFWHLCCYHQHNHHHQIPQHHHRAHYTTKPLLVQSRRLTRFWLSPSDVKFPPAGKQDEHVSKIWLCLISFFLTETLPNQPIFWLWSKICELVQCENGENSVRGKSGRGTRSGAIPCKLLYFRIIRQDGG